MRIGVDIDGVLADSLPLWVSELNKFFNKNKLANEIHLYDLLQTFEITSDQFNDFIVRKGQYMMSAPHPIPGAVHYLKKIKERHHIAIVTARQEVYRGVTEDWLMRHGMFYDDLFLTGSYKKERTCLDLDLQVMIEDTLEVGLDLSAAGIPVFLLDAPYNRKELPELICRKFSWREIYDTLVVNDYDA